MKAHLFKLLLIGAAFILSAGCIVLSVYPFYTNKDLVSEPGLAGRWIKTGKTNEVWQFTVSGEKSFMLTTTDEDSTNGFEAHVFQLEQYQFLDLFATNREMLLLPLHLVAKLSRNDTNLTLFFLDYGWLARLLETNPVAARHIVVPQEPGNTNGGNMVYLTGQTRELQKFLLKHAADTNAFSADALVQLRRASP